MSLILNKYIGKTVEIRTRPGSISGIQGKILDIDDTVVEVELNKNSQFNRQMVFECDTCIVPICSIEFICMFTRS